MANKKNGGSAFPVQSLKQMGQQTVDNDFDFAEDGQEGITKRDYFAAAAMQGIYGGRMPNTSFKAININDVTKYAYLIADAMLEAREK
jgi:hypothetical protein